MFRRDYRDIVGGIILFVVGLGIAFYASANYQMGTLRQMGPGMFPAGLGYLLAFLGVLSILPALMRPGDLPKVKWWPALLILAAVAAFAILIRPLGLIPAIVAATIISSQAEGGNRPLAVIGLCAFLVALSYAIFIFALQLPMRVFNWPF